MPTRSVPTSVLQHGRERKGSGRPLTSLCKRMANNRRRRVGEERSDRRLQTRIHCSSSHEEEGGYNTSSSKQATKRLPSGGGRVPPPEESHLSNLPTLYGGVLVNVLPGSQEDGRLETHTEFETSEQIHKTKKVQNGMPSNGSESSHSRLLGNLDRLKGCLSSCANPPRPSEMAKIFYQGPGLCLQVPPFWPVYSPQSFYTGGPGCRSIPSSTGSPDPSIFGRLADHQSHSGHGSSPYKVCVGNSVQARLYSQCKEVSNSAVPDPTLLGSQDRSCTGKSVSLSGESDQSSILCKDIQSSRNCASSSVAKDIRPDGEYGGLGALLQTQNEACPAPPALLLSTECPPSVQVSTTVGHHTQRVDLVGGRIQSLDRSDLSNPPSAARVNHGRISDGVGGPSPGLQGQWSLASGSDYTAYQYSGALSSVQLSERLGEPFGVAKQTDLDSIGQLNSSVLYQKAGGDTVPISMPSHQATPMVVCSEGDISVSHSHSGGKECPGRQPVTGGVFEPHRVVSSPPYSADSFPQNGVLPRHRSFCYTGEQANTSILFKELGQGRICDRRPVHTVDRVESICVPPDISNLQSNSKDSERGLRTVADSTLLGATAVVSITAVAPSGNTIVVAKPAGLTKDAGKQGEISQCRPSKVSCMDAITQQYVQAGFSKESANLAARGRRESTLRVYSSRLRPYFEWCNERQTDPYHTSIAEIADFLRSLHTKGLQASTIKGYKSAITLIHRGLPDGSRLRDDPDRFLHFMIEGMNNVNPPPRKIMPEWDLGTVLRRLNESPYEPLHAASPRDLAVKTAFLIAVASGKRCSELHALASGDHIVFGSQGATLHFRPDFLAKNERSNFSMTPLFIPYLLDPSNKKERKGRLSCPVRALRWYLNRTETSRQISKSTQLFITTQKPYKPAAKPTIAGWIMSAIIKAKAVVQGNPTAHSTRAISTSWAYSHGLTVSEIRNTVSWRTETTFVSRYLRDVGPCCDKAKFATSVLTAGSHDH